MVVWDFWTINSIVILGSALVLKIDLDPTRKWWDFSSIIRVAFETNKQQPPEAVEGESAWAFRKEVLPGLGAPVFFGAVFADQKTAPGN